MYVCSPTPRIVRHAKNSSGACRTCSHAGNAAFIFCTDCEPQALRKVRGLRRVILDQAPTSLSLRVRRAASWCELWAQSTTESTSTMENRCGPFLISPKPTPRPPFASSITALGSRNRHCDRMCWTSERPQRLCSPLHGCDYEP